MAPVRVDRPVELLDGDARQLIGRLPGDGSVQCVVTSPAYWATRLYGAHVAIAWADGETSPYGHEQTPEGFIRHTVELLFLLKRVLASGGSVWWNLMDTYNTRTAIRRSAAEALRAMNGSHRGRWSEHEVRRYSAGHSFLQDGEQCLIPTRVAERASRIGYFVKSLITWKKASSMPETARSRVTRELEYVIHLSLRRAPLFHTSAYRLPAELGGRDLRYEAAKLTDVWVLPTAAGRGDHGAQFPVALPARCIALSSDEGDLVLDPFIGSGATAVAARRLARRIVGFDVSSRYLVLARSRVGTLKPESS